MLSLRNSGNPLICPPMGRFPTIGVGFRPIGELFGGVLGRHQGSVAGGGAFMSRTVCQLQPRRSPNLRRLLLEKEGAPVSRGP
jgi:hypothetical protein